jgi:hypothetical protein
MPGAYRLVAEILTLSRRSFAHRQIGRVPVETARNGTGGNLFPFPRHPRLNRVLRFVFVFALAATEAA